MWLLKDKNDRLVLGFVFFCREDARKKKKEVQKWFPHNEFVIVNANKE